MGMKKTQFVLKTESMQSLWNLWTHAAELISKQTGDRFLLAELGVCVLAVWQGIAIKNIVCGLLLFR